MPAILSEDFSSYAADTQLKNISGWEVLATSTAFSQNLKVNASAELKLDYTDGCLARYDALSPSHYSEFKYTTQSDLATGVSGAILHIGPAVRCFDRLYFIGFSIESNTRSQLFYRSGGAITPFHTFTSLGIVIGDVVRLSLDNDTNLLEVYVNGVLVESAIDVSAVPVTVSNKAGLFASGTFATFADDVEIGTLGALPNQLPVADAGIDQSVAAGADFTLDFSASYDNDGTIASYAVTQTAGDAVTLIAPTASTRTSTAPTQSYAQTLTFSLIVTDNLGAESVADTVNINVAAEGVTPTTSTAVITIAGISDGTHDIKLWSEVTDTILYDGSVTFSSDIGNATVTADVGTAFTGRWLSSNPPTTGTGVYGVTE